MKILAMCKTFSAEKHHALGSAALLCKEPFLEDNAFIILELNSPNSFQFLSEIIPTYFFTISKAHKKTKTIVKPISSI